MTTGLFVFEGPDGVGKSTLAVRLNALLNEKGFPSELVSFPGCEPGTVGELVYRLHHDPLSLGVHSMSVESEQLLFTAAHCDVIQRRILPALAAGQNIVLDRYWWSTWVYGSIENLESSVKDLLIELELAIWGTVKPECVFLVRRDRAAGSEYGPVEWGRICSTYESVRAREAGRLRIVDVENNGELRKAMECIQNAVWNNSSADVCGRQGRENG